MTETVFLQALRDSGCILSVDDNDAPAVFACEPVLFRRDLSIKIRSDAQYPNNLTTFFESMNDTLLDLDMFRRFLLPATLSEEARRSTRSTSFDSVAKTLLQVDILQKDLIDYLLERLPEFYDELENDQSSTCTARLILHQLRWSEYIVDPQALSGKLIEIIQITPPVIQHEIITSLPDIINDTEHKAMVVYLKELMNEYPELTVPILDALSNLTSHSESLEDVRDTVLDRLEQAEQDDLAVILKFLLQTVSPSTIDMVIYGIREKLDFRSLGRTQSTRQRNENAAQGLILESIKLGLQFHKYVCDSWFKSIAALETKNAHKPIDVLVLFILYSMTSTKKKAEVLFRKKITGGLITARLLRDVILHHADGLTSYWNAILSLAESLLRSAQQTNAIAPCSNALYINAFKFSDAYHRQEIVGSLVTHIGSGSTAEMDAALDVLLHLSENDVNNMAVYDVFIKGILDYLDNLSLSQIRTLFNIFSLLALTASDKDNDGSHSSLWSEIQIVIRKQLSNPREKYKKIGVVGCLAIIKVLGSNTLCNASSAAESSTQSRVSVEQVSRHPLLRQSIQMLEMIMRNCAEYPNCLVLMYDELAYMVEYDDLDKRLQLWIKNNFTDCFTEEHVMDIASVDQVIKNMNQRSDLCLKPQNQLGVDNEDEESNILIGLYPTMCSSDDRQKRRLVLTLCPIFNLIQTYERVNNNNDLAEIDGLLGCGIILFKWDEDDLQELIQDLPPDEMQNACDMLFYTINWIRELLNAFCRDDDEDNHAKLVRRIKNVLSLEALLEQFIKSMGSYTPLEFHSMTNMEGKDSMRSLHSISSSSTPRSPVPDASDADSKPSVKKASTHLPSFDSVNSLRPFMRALNVDVIAILEHHDNDQENLQYEEVNYILEDLCNKLEKKVVPTSVNPFGKKKTSDDKQRYQNQASYLLRLNARDLLKQVVTHLPIILQRLENLYEDIQLQDTQSGRYNSGSEPIVHCAANIFNVIYKLFSWPDIGNPENQDILETVFGVLADRLAVENTQSQSFTTKAQEAFKYLARFSDNMPEASTAVVLFKTLMRIKELSGTSDSLRSNAHSVVTGILKEDWFDWRNIKKEIPYLLEQAIELDQDPLSTLHDYVNNVLESFEENGSLEEHPLLRTDTVLSYYQAMINQTVKALHLLQETHQDATVILVQNSQIVKIFWHITSYTKTKDQRALFGMILKTGRSFVDQFAKHSIPFFTNVFRSHKNEIVDILRNFQKSTRMLQIICSHVKVIKDVQLSTYVPPLKRSLEIVIFQVKMLLTENNAPSDAFFMGALKHRDIRGEEVQSQLPREESGDEGDELNSDRMNSDDMDTDNEEEDQQEAHSVSSHRPSQTRQETPPPAATNNESDDVNEVTMEIDFDSETDDDEQSYVAPNPPIIAIQDDEDEEDVKMIESEDVSKKDESLQVQAPRKKRRMGLGRPAIPNKVFSLTRDE